MTHDEIVTFVDEDLGLVVDPPRIPDRHRAEAAARGLEIAFTADTQSHADYVSGSPELAAKGAVFLASKDAEQLAGEIGGGLDAWRTAGFPVTTVDLVDSGVAGGPGDWSTTTGNDLKTGA